MWSGADMWIGEDRGEERERKEETMRERDGPSIRGFGIASDDGIFQNVKTNIAKPRLPTGMGHLDYDSQTTPHPRFALDILPSSRAISQNCPLSLPYPIHCYVAGLVPRSWPYFSLFIYVVCVYMYMGDVIYTEKVYRVAH